MLDAINERILFDLEAWRTDLYCGQNTNEPNTVDQLRAAVEIGKCRAPSREFGPTLFNQAYFIKNFLKCLVAASKVIAGAKPTSFFDLGSGAGTFSLAVNAIRIGSGDHFELVDRDRGQLDLANRLVARSRDSDKFTYVHSELSDHTSKSGPGIRLCSYVFCETLLDGDLFSIEPILRSGAVIVDYPEVIHRIASVAKRFEIPFTWQAIDIEVPEPLRAITRQNNIKVCYAHSLEP